MNIQSGLLILLAYGSLPGGFYDAAADFSVSMNPAREGTWSYGWESKLRSELNLYTQHYDLLYWGSRVIGWSRSGEGPQHGDYCCPFIALNVSGRTITPQPLEPIDTFIPPGQLWFHPGPRGEYSIIRWICPSPGHYRVTVRFDALGPATADVHVLKNDTVLGEEELGRDGFAYDFSFESLEIRANDRLDFAVGYGSDHTYEADITGLSVRIQALAEN